MTGRKMIATTASMRAVLPLVLAAATTFTLAGCVRKKPGEAARPGPAAKGVDKAREPGPRGATQAETAPRPGRDRTVDRTTRPGRDRTVDRTTRPGRDDSVDRTTRPGRDDSVDRTTRPGRYERRGSTTHAPADFRVVGQPPTTFQRRPLEAPLVRDDVARLPVRRQTGTPRRQWDYVWLEGEKPAEASFKWAAAGAKKGHLLSGDKWLSPEKRVDLPDEGYLLAYDANVPKPGKYALWLRVGFEWIRANVAWRLDGGRWTSVGIAARLDEKQRKKLEGRPKPDLERRSTNVMELDTWNEAAWWTVGEAELDAGTRRLELRFTKTHIDNPLVALDAIVLVRGNWTPEGKLKPGEVYDRELDREAAAHVFRLPDPAAGGERSEVALTGPWQVARYDDPDMNVDTYEPVRKLPSADELSWMGHRVPDPLRSTEEMVFAHRVVYRTRVHVPAAYQGHGFKLHFSGTNWIVSVFVNGRYAGDHRGVWVPWDLDCTGLVRPGRVNDIAVAVKGSYYTYDPLYHGGDLNLKRNVPLGKQRWSRWIAPIYPSTKGDGDGLQCGIVNPVRLVAAGSAYTEDVFIKPSVERKKLVTEVTVRNTTDRTRRLGVVCEAVYDRDGPVGSTALTGRRGPVGSTALTGRRGPVGSTALTGRRGPVGSTALTGRRGTAEKSFGPVSVTVGAGRSATVTVEGGWENPKLWWPLPNPDLYRLRTKLLEDGAVVDVHEELFGFREVTWKGPAIFINGVRRNFWCWVDIKGRPAEAADYERIWRAEGNRCLRFSHGRRLTSHLKSREERLEYYDRTGMAGRLCSMIDGMFINYVLLDRQGRGRERKVTPNEPVWEGFRRHVAQMTRAYRNHPSVIFYQIENELVYINGMNIYGGDLPLIEKEMLKVYEAGKASDSTRPYTVGGGGDLSKAEGIAGPEDALEINCPHYPSGSLEWYPDNAYTMERVAAKVARWPWDRKKPWIAGESSHAASLEAGSYVSGPVAFRSQDEANRGKAKYLRMLYGGYRWAGTAGWFPWDNLSAYEDGKKTFSDICIIPRKQTHRLYSGRENRLLFKIMNDTFSGEPVTFEWSYEAGGRRIAGEKKSLEIEPGYGVEETVVIRAPRAERRLEGKLTLRASQAGADDFVDERSVPVLPVVDRISVKTPVTVLDLSGKVTGFLERAGVRFARIDALEGAKGKRGLLIVGPDSLTPGEAWGQDLLAFAARGGRAIVLEQENPVAGGNAPAPLKTTTSYGGYAHPQAVGTPLFRDLGREDLIDWAGDHPTCRNVYVKPSQGARSLVECGVKLPHSALVEMAAGRGVIVLCQLRVGAKLGVEPAADVMLRNMVEHYAGYRPSDGVAALVSPNSAPRNALLVKSVEATGALQKAVGSVEAALDPGKYRVAVIDATKPNLDALNALKPKADVFTDKGGWIMLCGVRPESIDGVNRLLGTRHLLRPFRIEREHMTDTDSAVAATLGDGDVMLYGTEWIARWAGKRWVSGNTFGYVIDSYDAAPFTYPPGAKQEPYAYAPSRDDKDPYNFVNGMLGSDFWRYIRQIWIEDDGPKPLVFTLRQPETLREIRIWNNANYSTIEDLDVIFDGDEAGALRMKLPDSSEMTALRLPEPRRAGKTITFQVRTWRRKAHGNPNAHRLIGIDNVEFIRAERPSRAKFLDRAGGLVAFHRGEGGVFLNQVKFMEDEPVRENADKKVRLTGTILQNMGCGTRTSVVAVPGVNIRYETVDLTDHGTQYLTMRQGRACWFGRKGRDLAKLPLGKGHFADVEYHVVDYSTAPVPDCIVLGGLRGSPQGLKAEVTGIGVGRRADAVFFMHAANVTRRISDRERSHIGDRRRPFSPPEVARYVLHYGDGRKHVIPVVLEKHVDHWLQKGEPKPLEGAAVAWASKMDGRTYAVLYSMKVVNPRPEVKIATVDVMPGLDEKGKKVDRAVPAVVAITLGIIRE